MTSVLPTSRAGIFQGFAAFLSKRGVKFSHLLSEVGLQLEDLADPAANLPLEKVVSIFERAAVETGDPCLGLHWGEAYPVGGSGVFGYAISNARTLRESMQAAARYLGLVMSPADIIFSEDDGLARLAWTTPLTDGVNVQYVMVSVTATLMRLRSVAGSGWQPFAIDFMLRDVPCETDLRRILGPTVNFNMPENAIIVDSSTLNRASGSGDLRLYTLVSELGNRLLKEQTASSDIVNQTRKEILEALRREDASLETVAAALQLPPRTLQTKLAQSGTSFDTLFQDTRKQLAARLLRDTDKPLTEIALMLGFSEQSAFARACSKRWFGMSPSAYRQQTRKE
jgi:AraC-like DNA-binding protein